MRFWLGLHLPERLVLSVAPRDTDPERGPAIGCAWNQYLHFTTAQCLPGPTTTAKTTSSTTSKTSSTSTSSTKTSTSSTKTSTTSATSTKTSTTLTTSTKTTSTTSSASSTATVDNCSLQYLISFGDSYSQTGFDVTSTKPSSSNPLGNPPLPGWTASGGLNWVGFLVSQFNQSTLLSYNFAYGGATTNATIVTPYASTVLSLIDQVAQFSGSIGKKPSYAPWGDNALFAVWIGVNDVGNSWWLSNYDDVVKQIMTSYFGQLQVLYDAGARNFALLTVPRKSHLPLRLCVLNYQLLTAPTAIQRAPVNLLNTADSQAAEGVSIGKYNAAIATSLAAFTAKNSGITAKIVDTTAPFNTALDNPTAYGAPNNTCYNADGKSCLWFNDYHPGIEINRLVAKAVAAAWKDSFF